jgi:hypothetical protein
MALQFYDGLTKERKQLILSHIIDGGIRSAALVWLDVKARANYLKNK